jgi:hypothetical protein
MGLSGSFTSPSNSGKDNEGRPGSAVMDRITARDTYKDMDGKENQRGIPTPDAKALAIFINFA